MSSKFCETCGTANEEGAKFCLNCGKTIDQVSPSPSQAVQYAAPVQQAYNPEPQQPNYYQQPINNAPMKVVQYIGTMLLLCIPIANIILLFMWAFGSDTNVNKKNFARAILILGLISIVASIVLTIVTGGLNFSMIQSGQIG